MRVAVVPPRSYEPKKKAKRRERNESVAKQLNPESKGLPDPFERGFPCANDQNHFSKMHT